MKKQSRRLFEIIHYRGAIFGWTKNGECSKCEQYEPSPLVRRTRLFGTAALPGVQALGMDPSSLQLTDDCRLQTAYIPAPTAAPAGNYVRVQIVRIVVLDYNGMNVFAV